MEIIDVMDNFEYKLKKDSIKDLSENYLENYLRDLGIRKVNSFLNMPSPIDEEPAILLDNIDLLCEGLKEAFENEKKFFLQVDADADGITSSAIFYNYFKALYPDADIEYRVHEGKEHGIILSTVSEEADIIIIPDAGSNQKEEIQHLITRGQKVYVMDHHHAEELGFDPNEAIIVNNQLSKSFKNKDLSGAGVVYKVIQYFSKMYSDGEDYKNYTDLAALGIISDMMNTKNLDNNFIIFHGLKHIKNPMLKALLEKQSYSVSDSKNPNKIDIAFYITPLINGVIREGTYEENEMLFEGFITMGKEKVMFDNTFRGKTKQENYYERVARLSSNIRQKQNNKKLKAMKFLDEKIEKSDYKDHGILVAITSKEDEIPVPKTMTGLVAMELLKKHKKPVLVLRPKTIDKEQYLFGSGRAKGTVGFDSFRNALRELPYIELAEGHDMAFGFGIREDNLPKMLEDITENLKDIDFGSDIIEVDYVFDNANLNKTMLKEFAEAIDLFGNGIPQPKFAFKIMMNAEDFKVVGKKSDTIIFSHKGVDFIKFRSAEMAEHIENHLSGLVEVELIGRAQINEFMGRRKVQIVADKMKIKNKKYTDLI